jgi:hypothetical protein
MPKHGSAWPHSSSDSNAKDSMKGESDRARITVPPPLLGLVWASKGLTKMLQVTGGRR